MIKCRGSREVSDVKGWEGCPLCKRGHMVMATVDSSFRQKTDRGQVTCRLTLPVSTCSHCGFEWLDADAEARIDRAVRLEYDKLPPAGEESK